MYTYEYSENLLDDQSDKRSNFDANERRPEAPKHNQSPQTP